MRLSFLQQGGKGWLIRRAHNAKTAGSNPAPAPICQPGRRNRRLAFFLVMSHPEWRLRA